MYTARSKRSAMRNFGPYTSLVEIGRGGMATVYRATALDGHLVALKLMPAHLAADATTRARFEQESRLSLNHPNIVRVNKAGVVDGTPYIEMEYVAGESLDRLIAHAGPLPPQALAGILLDIARALDYAHGQGVIHRDVKPSNIIVRSDGRALLTDFGVAKAAGVTAYTATTARVGSVLFMSPEQAAGAFEITEASDIYSLGVTAYYALTGRAPFEGGSDVAIARQHIERAPTHVSDAHPAIARAVGDVVMWALEKVPARRPPSAGAFARRFAAALSAPPAPASSEPAARPAPVAGRPASVEDELERRGRVPPWLTIGLGATLALAGVVILVLIAMLLIPGANPSGFGSSATPTLARPASQPGLSIFTVQPATATATRASVPALTTPTPQPIAPVRPVIVATATRAPALPSPTRPALPTRGPISPLTPIVADGTPPPAPPTATDGPTTSPLPASEVIVVTGAP